jgi:hypothetical protein
VIFIVKSIVLKFNPPDSGLEPGQVEEKKEKKIFGVTQ